MKYLFQAFARPYQCSVLPRVNKRYYRYHYNKVIIIIILITITIIIINININITININININIIIFWNLRLKRFTLPGKLPLGSKQQVPKGAKGVLTFESLNCQNFL